MADGGRVIAGSAAGVRLAPAERGTRPLSDRVKQALFAALSADGAFAPGAAFLDLFAGTGAGGIEALSRGAERAVFVEQAAGACRVIADNLERSRLANGSVVCADVASYLERDPISAGGPFRAVLIDPPYGMPLLEPALTRLAGGGWLRPDATVVAKHFWRDQPPERAGELHLIRQRRFGETMLTFYRTEER
jgi:16S rRNA (guanine966-N2)-methyltransferase